MRFETGDISQGVNKQVLSSTTHGAAAENTCLQDLRRTEKQAMCERLSTPRCLEPTPLMWFALQQRRQRPAAICSFTSSLNTISKADCKPWLLESPAIGSGCRLFNEALPRAYLPITQACTPSIFHTSAVVKIILAVGVELIPNSLCISFGARANLVMCNAPDTNR